MAISTIEKQTPTISPNNTILTATLATRDNNIYVEYDYQTKTLVIPGSNFIVIDGKGYGHTGTTLNLSSILNSEACCFYVNSSYNIYAISWGTQATSTSDRFLGYIYGKHVRINGVPEYHVRVKNTDGNIVYGLADSDCGIGLAGDQYITYNTTTKILTIPGGNNFVMWKGTGIPHSTTTSLDLTNILVNDACIFYITSAGSIYAKKWNGCYATNMSDQMIGYYYRGSLHFNYIPDSKIKVISDDDIVYCFGDSLVAGVNTTKAFHMYWSDWTKNAVFNNYGDGGTGYVTTYTGTGLKGTGDPGIGTSQSQSGNNTIRQVMSSVVSLGKNMNNIIIFGGTNDWGSNVAIDAFRTEVDNTLTYALGITSNILVISPIKRKGWEINVNSQNKYLKDYCDVIEEVCAEKDIPFVSGYDVMLNPSIQSIRNKYFSSDGDSGLHPNALGHARIARMAFNKMQEAICK